MGKGKGSQPGELRRRIEDLKKSWKDLSARIARDHDSFRKEWSSKFNGLGKQMDELTGRFKKIVMATGQQLAQIQTNIQVHSNVLEQLDINVQAVGKMHLENYGRFEQIDVFLSMLEQLDDLTQEQLTEIRERAKESYEATMNECFRQVHEERAAAVKDQRQAAEKAKKEATEEAEASAEARKEAEDKEESEMAQHALQDAETRGISTNVGGQGADIPDGADVFGG